MIDTATATHHERAAVADARRELKRAERALARAGRDPMLVAVARERRDAAALRYLALTAASPAWVAAC